MGTTALVALLHDVLVVVGVFAILGHVRRDADRRPVRDGDADRHRLLGPRHDRRVRPGPREPRAPRRRAVRPDRQPLDPPDARPVDHDQPDRRHHAAGAAAVRRARRSARSCSRCCSASSRGPTRRSSTRHRCSSSGTCGTTSGAKPSSRLAQAADPPRDRGRVGRRPRSDAGRLAAGKSRHKPDMASSATMIDARHRWVLPGAPPSRSRAPGGGPRARSRDLRGDGPGPARDRRRRRRMAALPRPGRGRPERPPAAARRGPPGRAHPPRASSGDERVMVFGDFDADGLTGLAQLVLAFRRLGLDTRARTSRRRLEEGHGLSMAAVEAAARDGDRADRDRRHRVHERRGDRRGRARRGIDVIVTDHHHLPDVLPAAVAIVNPQRADSAYPDRTAVGVGRGVHGRAAAARRAGRRGGRGARARGPRDDRDRVGRRRRCSARTASIAQLGLERMRTAPRPGIAALLAKAGVAPAAVDLETVGFVLAPRLNAAGPGGGGARRRPAPARRDARGGDRRWPRCSRRPTSPAATSCAARSPRLERRSACPTRGRRRASRRGSTRPAPADTGIRVAGGPDAAALLADRPVARRHHRPRRGTPRRRDADVPRSSARSSGARRRRRPRLVPERRSPEPRPRARRLRRPAAAARRPRRGGRVRAARSSAGTRSPSASSPRRRPRRRTTGGGRSTSTSRCRPAFVDYGLYRDLARLAPCGTGNPEPLVAVLGLTVQRVRAANGGHTQLVLRRERDVLDGIAFGRPDLAEGLAEGDRVDVVARLASRTFGGLETLQLEVRDVSASGAHPARGRGPRPRGGQRRRHPRHRRCGRAGRQRSRMTSRPNGATPRAAAPPRPRPVRPAADAACRSPPCVSIVGLLVIAIVTLNLTNGQLPFTPGGGGRRAAGHRRGPDADRRRRRTIVDRRRAPEPGHRACPGTLVYAKDGNIWVQTGDQATQLTAPGKGVDDSMPSFSQDGKSVYFVRTRKADGQVEHRQRASRTTSSTCPTLMRVNVADGTTDRLLDGLVDPARRRSSGTGSSASRSSRPTAATSRWRPTCPTPRRAT